MAIYPVITIKSFFVTTDAGGLLTTQLNWELQPMELVKGRKISTKAFEEIWWFKSFYYGLH